MRNAWLTRVNTLFLALLLAGGGSGLPVVDALFHHLHGATPDTTQRVADGESSGSHGERCTLGAPLPAMDGAGSVAAAPRALAAAFSPPALPATDAPRSGAVSSTAHPRAPPSAIG